MYLKLNQGTKIRVMNVQLQRKIDLAEPTMDLDAGAPCPQSCRARRSQLTCGAGSRVRRSIHQ